MTIYPVSGGKFINVAAIKRVPGATMVYEGPWMEPTNAETVVKLFENWEPKALAIAKVRLYYIIMSTLATRYEVSLLIFGPHHRRFRSHSSGQYTSYLSCRPTSKDEPPSSETLYVKTLFCRLVARI